MLLKESNFEIDEGFKQALEELCNQELWGGDNIIKISSLSKNEIYSIARKLLREKFPKKKKLDYMETLKIIKGEGFSIKLRDGFVINQSNDDKEKTKERYRVWEKNNSSEQNVFYLHGALHIYKDSLKIKKYITNKRKVDFINAIQDFSGKDFSHISAVFEKEKKDKEDKIQNNSYLKYCFEKLKNLKGELTIIGWACSDNDQHLIDAIKESTLSKIVYYYHGEQAPEHLSEKFSKKIEFKPTTELPYCQ